MVGDDAGVREMSEVVTRPTGGAEPEGVVRRAVRALAAVPLVAVVAVAIGVRVLAGVAFPAAETETYEFGWLARNIVDGRGYAYYADDPVGRLTPEESGELGAPFPSAYMPPLYTFLTAGAVELGDTHEGTVWLVRLANLASAAAGVLVMHALARRLVGQPGARLAALGFALYPAIVYLATQVSAANLYVTLELGVLVLLLRASTSAAWRHWLAAGAGLGLVCLLRAEAVALVPLAAAWLVWTARRHATPRRAVLAAVFLSVALAMPGVWLVRNSLALGTPVAAVTSSGGKNLWIGNHDGASGSQKDFTIPETIEDEIRALEPGDDFEARADAIYRREAIDSITGDPVGTALRDVKKAALLLGADVHDRRNLNPLYLGPYVIVLGLGAAGFVTWWRRRPAGDTVRWLIVGYVAFSVAVPTIFFALARYRLPVEMMLLVFAAAWVAERAGPPAPDRAATSLGPMGRADRRATGARI